MGLNSGLQNLTVLKPSKLKGLISLSKGSQFILVVIWSPLPVFEMLT